MHNKYCFVCLQHLLLLISSSFLLLRKHFFSFGCHNLSSCVSWRGKERTVSCYLNGVGNLAFFFTPFNQGKKAKNNNTKFSSKEKSWWNANSFQMKRNGAVAGIGKKNTNSDQVCTKPDQNSKSKFISSGLSIYNRNFLSSSDEIPATDALVPSALLGHRTLLN